MHHFPYPSYLRTHRDAWSLTQAELGALLGVPADLISKYERLVRTPNVEAVIGAEFVFGEPGRRIFPALYTSIELGVTSQSALLAEVIAKNDSKTTRLKRELLEAIALRAMSDKSII